MDLTNVTVINSRFRGIKNIKFDVLPCDERCEFLDIELLGVAGENNEELFNTVVKKLDEILQPLRA